MQIKCFLQIKLDYHICGKPGRTLLLLEHGQARSHIQKHIVNTVAAALLLFVCFPPADALSSSSTPDLSSAAESAKDAASDLKSKAKSVLKGNSALFNSSATVADLNADVRGTSESYRDPAIDPIQDKIKDKVSGENTLQGSEGLLCMCLLGLFAMC